MFLDHPNGPLRVLHVISGIDPENGGPTAALLGLTCEQVRLGFDVRVIATWQHSSGLEHADRFRERGISVTMVGPARGKLSRHPSLRQEVDLAVRSADIVHIHALFEDIQHQAAVSARKHSKPYIFRPCGMLDPWSLRQRALFKRLYWLLRLRRNLQHTAAIHAVSAIEAQHIQALDLRVPVIVEPNGLNLAEFDALPTQGSLRAACERIGSRPIILFMSRLHPKKGLDILIPAMRQVLERYADEEQGRQLPFLVIAGPGERPYLDKVRQSIAEHRLEAHTWLPGMLRGRDRIAALADAEMFVLPSYEENFGIAIIEALAAGLPTITTDRVGLHPMIQEVNAGLIRSPEVAAIADAMVELLDNETLRQNLSDRARSWCLSTFNWETIARHWTEHYAKLCLLDK